MARLFKRKGSPFWQFDFRFRGTRHQGTTHLKNKEKAESWVAKFRADLALGIVGLKHIDPPPILKAFLEGPFLADVQQNCRAPRTKLFYKEKVKVLCSYTPFTQLRLDRIDELAIQGYRDFRLNKILTPTIQEQAGTLTLGEMGQLRMPATTNRHLSPSTINAELRTLRKALRFADNCGLIRYRGVRTLPGETNRTYVLDGATEARYLALADYPLKQVAILMLDLGLRPEEAVRLRKADILKDSVVIRAGKTANAQRTLPHTQRTDEVFQLCFALFPDSEWVFPGRKGQHFTRGAIDNLHTKLRDGHRSQPGGLGRRPHNIHASEQTGADATRTRSAGEATGQFPKEFVLYSLRHTFATRLAESCGGDTFVLMKALGHANTRMCERYVHINHDYLNLAMKRKELLDKAIRGEIVEPDISPVKREH